MKKKKKEAINGNICFLEEKRIGKYIHTHISQIFLKILKYVPNFGVSKSIILSAQATSVSR